VAFDLPLHTLDGLPLMLRVSPVESPHEPADPAAGVLWLAAQPLGGPVVHRGHEAAGGPPRSGWDHVLNHDVRSGIRNARSFTGLYRRRLGPPADAGPDDAGGTGLPDPHLLDTALRALANADRAMEDLVRLHRINTDRLAMGPVAVADLCVSACLAAEDRLAELVASGHDDLAGGLTVLGPGRAGEGAPGSLVIGNEPLLAWLLAELMVNARKFAGEPTVVTVTVEDDGSGWLTILVANTGAPVDPHLAEEAFGLGRMLQARGVRPGVGLGLPLARRIAARHAGRLVFTPDPDGAGTVLELRLLGPRPATPAPTPEP
jgi:two-component system sensor histidine kinase TctE